jgi:hypothetical protein
MAVGCVPLHALQAGEGSQNEMRQSGWCEDVCACVPVIPYTSSEFHPIPIERSVIALPALVLGTYATATEHQKAFVQVIDQPQIT